MPHTAKNPGVGTGHGIRQPRERTCIDCGETFPAVRADALRCGTCKRRRTTERDVAARRVRVKANGGWRRKTQCPQCGGPKDHQAATCWDCIPRGGEHNANWKGGVVKNGDYMSVRLQRGRSKYTLQHIAVWEAANGPLPHGWNVHHLNGIKTDNRLENLLALPSQEHHSHPHEAIKPYEARIRTLEDRLRAAGLPID